MALIGSLSRAVQQAAVRPVRSDLPEVEDLARQVAELQRIVNPWAKGVTIDLVATGAGALTIQHRLGRNPTGWIITDQSTGVTIHKVSADTKNIILSVSGATTAKVLVY